MNFFRNPEIKRSLLLYLTLMIMISTLSFILGTNYGIMAMCLSLVYSLLYFTQTYERYKKIAELSRELNLILHGKEALNLSAYSEGELAILQSEISKMTIQLRNQADSLSKDKRYLADSIADISHQIRTPLTSINLITNFLAEPDLTISRRLELTKELTKLLARIDWLINSLLKMSRLDAGTANLKSELVSVRELISKSTGLIAIPMELRELQLQVNMTGEESFVGDFSWSLEAITNILKNCMEYTPSGGIIQVKAVENAIYTEIRLRDNGKGFDEDDLPYLFERFYKGKNSSKQSIGIGLALSRMIITSQNGTIKAENIDGSASFTIRFYKGTI